jgi:hypothetical protein
VIEAGDVIVSNQVSLLEWLFLEMAYSPCFTAVCIKDGRYGLRKVGMLEAPFYAIGLKFPREVSESENNFFTDIAALRDSQYVRHRPIVVFPEGTKTNGGGILHFQDTCYDILMAAAKGGLRIHSVRFDYDFVYAAPHNTTDVFGLKTTVKLMTQVRNVMLIQYYFNLEEKLLQPIPVSTATPKPAAQTTLGGAKYGVPNPSQ